MFTQESGGGKARIPSSTKIRARFSGKSIHSRPTLLLWRGAREGGRVDRMFAGIDCSSDRKYPAACAFMHPALASCVNRLSADRRDRAVYTENAKRSARFSFVTRERCLQFLPILGTLVRASTATSSFSFHLTWWYIKTKNCQIFYSLVTCPNIRNGPFGQLCGAASGTFLAQGRESARPGTNTSGAEF